MTLDAARKAEIRLDTEQELFRTSTRTRARPVDELEAARERERDNKRRRVVVRPRGGAWPAPPPLIRTGSADSLASGSPAWL